MAGLGDLVELPPTMGPAVGERHWAAGPEWIGQAAVGGVAVDLKRAAEAVEVSLGMFGAATLGIEEGYPRRV